MTREPPQRLFIFDVDGTLLLNGRIARDTYLYALKEVTGVLPKVEGPSFAGMTDKGIFRLFLRYINREDDFDLLFPLFADVFTNRLKTVYMDAEGPHILKGVYQLLESLSRDDSTALALGTGNIRESCYIKLTRFCLDRYFPVGGFGGDYEEREELIQAAIQEAKNYYGWNGDASNTWVIGDTPRDVAAGKANGTKTLAVASGIVDKDVLLKTDANFILDDMSDTKKVLDILMS